ncbi:MAG: hypothetical protein AMXMBFR33_40980 [Candidatus Xenobia bacterium]
MPLVPGQLLRDRYTIVRVLTSGGMGAVYEARDGHLDGAACAVKEMLEELLGTDDAELIQRKFEEEKALLARLKHPAIPAVRDFFRENRLCYIVMDYIHGANLQQQLEDSMQLTGQPFAPEVLVRDILQVLDALIYLHELDPPVVHRDIKPANLIREFKTGKIMLVDFGLARVVGGTRTQTAVGTLGYSPLEQIQGRSEPRSDLYALGVTMHHLLTNREPVPLEVTSLGVTDPGQDPALVAIVDRASAILPHERFASAREMRQALADWLAGRRSFSVTTAGAPVVRTDPAPTPSRAQPALVAMALLGTLLVGLWIGRGMTTAPAVAPSAMVAPVSSSTPSTVAMLPPAQPEVEPVDLPVPPAPPPPAAPPPPPPLQPVARPRPRPRPILRATPAPVTYPRARPRLLAAPEPAAVSAPPEPPRFPALSGSVRSLDFRGFALKLVVPRDYEVDHERRDESHLDLLLRVEKDGVERRILILAERNANMPDFAAAILKDLAENWQTVRAVSPEQHTYQLESPDAIGALMIFPGVEPSGPPVIYAVVIAQVGPDVSPETLKPEASMLFESISWRPPPPEGHPRPPR